MALRHFLSSLALAASLASTQAQLTTSYTDEATGITFQQKSVANYSFGIALPVNPTTDFIGQLSANTLTGWAGVSFTGSMLNSLLLVAWPNNGDIVSSLRSATNYALPTIVDGPILQTIASSTNETGFSYTFLCKNCMSTDATVKSLNVSADTSIFGWAIATTSGPSAPSSPSSSIEQHDTFGLYAVDIANAKSAKFASWAALASNVTAPSNPSNGTLPTNGTTPYNGTVTTHNTTYDYIVVGGGASGIVTAQRLTETGKSVLLLERGGPSFYSTGGTLTVPWNDTTTVYEVPGMFMQLSAYPGNKGYCSDTAGMAGCILGGGTAVNGMAFIKPPSFDFENWPVGWRWSDGVSEAADRLYARNPGTIEPSSDGKYYDNAVYDVLSKFLARAGWKSVSTNEEPDEKFQIYSYPAMNIANGRRSGPVNQYLPLALSEPNFTLKLHTKVLRAIRTNSTITGVETETDSGARTIFNVKPNGKVILAAGSMSSPRILFNSGIGPADQIEVASKQTKSITLPPKEAWINSPVGLVRDHSIIGINFNVTAGMNILPATAFSNPGQTDIDFFAQAAGPLVGNPQMRLNTFTTITTSDGSKLVVQTHCYSTANNTISMMFLLTHGTQSTGRLTMTTDGNTVFSGSPYLQSPTDKEALALAIDEMLTLSRRANSTLSYAGPVNDTGTAIVARTSPSPGTHMTGTTIIGTDDGSKNGTAVVDTNCKVYGTDNLFVVDAGMHADLPSGNTHVIVMVAAEHAAKKIIALDGGASNGTTPASSSAVLAPAPTFGAGGGYDTGSSSAGGISTPAASSVPSPADASSLPAAQTPSPSAAPANLGSGYDNGPGGANTEEPHPTIPSATAAPGTGSGYEVPSVPSPAVPSPSTTRVAEEKKWTLSEFITWLEGTVGQSNA
ncbi:Cellobiose dehydrogenase 7 [Paraphaeosphaeria sporulosa]